MNTVETWYTQNFVIRKSNSFVFTKKEEQNLIDFVNLIVKMRQPGSCFQGSQKMVAVFIGTNSNDSSFSSVWSGDNIEWNVFLIKLRPSEEKNLQINFVPLN